MEGDRGLILLCRAHVEGKIDLRQARPLDRHWWLSLVWTLDVMEQAYDQEELLLVHALYLSRLSAAPPEAVAELVKQVAAIQSILTSLRCPWREAASRPSSHAAGFLTQEWKRLFGDPKDPATAAKIDFTVRALREQAKNPGERRWPHPTP